ncbi:1-acyl-sn-glycerol-3-phosphate acyltransferase [Sphingobium subterraneum]|uniref:1-acyl-sn-glycerol-3-phosphate acyltransferase n=1 Tax=Sphingobium subterraneum TaxID=627688 RepID=A0A841J283_9SPHN|nr:lysophospholipid acyltransferase family protein [Sphingobium subterraneum]MBB6124927.1 1-acyl-sn-glycerol-3-phosphate acyltransferase [Sphingobium subterraneum]
MSIIILAIRSTLFAITFYGLSVFWILAAIPAGLYGQRAMLPFVRSWGWMHRLACQWILGQRVVIIGELPQEPMLYIFKHESMFETIDLLCLFPEPVIAAKQELLDIPGWGWIARRHGVIPLERKAGAKAMRQLQRKAKEAVTSGRPICLFPEGTRVPHGECPSLRSGFAGLYQLLKLPVVPVAIDTGRLSPRNGFLKRPGVITYKVGEIVPPGLPRDEAEAIVHAAINALNTCDCLTGNGAR